MTVTPAYYLALQWVHQVMLTTAIKSLHCAHLGLKKGLLLHHFKKLN